MGARHALGAQGACKHGTGLRQARGQTRACGARRWQAAGAGGTGVRAIGARGRAGRRQVRGKARQARTAWALGVRPGYGLCTRCTRPVFGPVRLSIFPESIFGHCS